MPPNYNTSKPKSGFFDFLWNPNIDSTRDAAFGAEQQYYDVYGDYIDKLKKYAADYPDFRKTLIQNGYMNSNGELDFGKLMDKDYLSNLDRVWKEDIINQQQAMGQAAQRQAQTQGGTQSTAMLRGINDAMANSRRNALNDYINKYKVERENAYGKGMTLNQQDLNSKLGAMNMDIESGAQETNKAGAFAKSQAETAQAQSKGFLQDPERIMKTAIGIGSMLIPGGQVAGAANLAGGLMPNNQTAQAGKVLGNVLSQGANMGSPGMVSPTGGASGIDFMKLLGLLGG